MVVMKITLNFLKPQATAELLRKHQQAPVAPSSWRLLLQLLEFAVTVQNHHLPPQLVGMFASLSPKIECKARDPALVSPVVKQNKVEVAKLSDAGAAVSLSR